MSRNINFKNLTGQKFGYLTALYVDKEKSTTHHTYWICRCICGNLRSLQTYQLTSEKVTSCGCKNPRQTKHFIINNRKRMYALYYSMLARCYNSKNTSYKYYGGKGITVCDEWKNDFNSFAKWAENNGYNDTLSIDRIDNAQGYSPQNCRWVTFTEQYKNKTTSVSYAHNGETHNLKEWCQILNFNYDLAKSRRKYAKKKNIEPTFEYVFSPPKFKRHS